MDQITSIERPTDVPDTGLLCDLLWADPEKDVEQWGENDRGVSFTFGPNILESFLAQHDLDLVCRAHQVRVQLLPVLQKIDADVSFTQFLGCRRWLRIFRRSPIAHFVLRTKLLRGV